MLFRFKRSKKTETCHYNWQDKIASNIVDSILQRQKECAIWLQLKSEHLSKNAKFTVLIVFIGLAGGYSTYLVAISLLSEKDRLFNSSELYNSIHIPKSLPKGSKAAFINEEESHRIHNFKQYLDSLHNTKDKHLLDSIISARPGLLDSILIIENNYESQSKK